jgi:small glutamine-rich tetratricopeptide repeat-containing protein alpha
VGGFDLGNLLGNPMLMNMATSMLSDPNMQRMMGQIMSGGAAEVGGGGPTNIDGLLEA